MSHGTKGQKFLHCPGTKGQQDKVKKNLWEGPRRDFCVVPQEGTGWNFDILAQDGPGWDFDSPNVAGQPHGTEGKKEVCPRIFAATLVPGQTDSGTRKLFLSWDNGTMGCPVPDFLGTFLGNSSCNPSHFLDLSKTVFTCPKQFEIQLFLDLYKDNAFTLISKKKIHGGKIQMANLVSRYN